jgi:hypothetical protein
MGLAFIGSGEGLLVAINEICYIYFLLVLSLCVKSVCIH